MSFHHNQWPLTLRLTHCYYKKQHCLKFRSLEIVSDYILWNLEYFHVIELCTHKNTGLQIIFNRYVFELRSIEDVNYSLLKKYSLWKLIWVWEIVAWYGEMGHWFWMLVLKFFCLFTKLWGTEFYQSLLHSLVLGWRQKS